MTTTLTAYDPAGYVFEQQAPQGDLTVDTVDGAGRVREVDLLPAGTGGGTWQPTQVVGQWGYDDADNLVAHTDADGRQEVTTYDGAGRALGTVATGAGNCRRARRRAMTLTATR